MAKVCGSETRGALRDEQLRRQLAPGPARAAVERFGWRLFRVGRLRFVLFPLTPVDGHPLTTFGGGCRSVTATASVAPEVRAASRVEGAAGLLRRQSALKFGPLDDAVDALLRRATSSELDQWGERILTAATVRDVFTD